MVDLADIETDPAERRQVMKGVNRVNQARAISADRRNEQIQGAMEILHEIQTDVQSNKLVFEQQTASELQTLVQPYDASLSRNTQFFLETNKRVNTNAQRLIQMRDKLQSDTLSWSEEKKLRKDFNELNTETLRLEQARRGAAQIIQQTHATRTEAVKTFVSSRNLQQQIEFDTQSWAQADRAEKKAQRLQAVQTMENISTGLINQMRTLQPGEAEAELQQGIGEFQWFNMNRGDPRAMDNFGRTQSAEAMANLNTLSPAERVSMAPAQALYARAKRDNEDLTWNDYKSILLREGRVDTARTVAQVSGDVPLQEALSAGVAQARRSTLTSLVQQWQKDNNTQEQPLPNQMEEFQNQANAAVGTMYARDIMRNTQAAIGVQASNAAGTAGQAIYKSEALTDYIDVTAYSPQIKAVVESSELQAVLEQPNLEFSDPIIGTTVKMMEVFENKGFTKDSGPMSKASAADAVADINRNFSLTNYRAKGGNNALVMDSMAMSGFPVSSGVLRMQLPSSLTRFVPDSEDRGTRPVYDLSDPADVLSVQIVTEKYSNVPRPVSRSGSLADQLRNVSVENLEEFSRARQEARTLREAAQNAQTNQE